MNLPRSRLSNAGRLLSIAATVWYEIGVKLQGNALEGIEQRPRPTSCTAWTILCSSKAKGPGGYWILAPSGNCCC